MLRIVLSLIAGFFFAQGVVAQEKTKTLEPKVVTKDEGAAGATKPVPKTMDTGEASDASKMVCKQGAAERTVEIKSDDATTKVPCRVHYRKVTEDPSHDQVLWNAQNDYEFCANKAKEFIAKLEGWGWSCSGTN